jgi:tetratricopeptide (TPR) repeat protein
VYALKAGAHVEIPAAVQGVVAARIDRLPSEAKWCLQAAAVIGREVPFSLLHALTDLPEDALSRRLEQLRGAEFLYETRFFPDHAYTFKHALTHEVAYESLLRERRRTLHARIVEIIEALDADRLTDQVERLAYHALQGEVWDKAVTYFRQAGVQATTRLANREAVACFEQALVALQHLPESRDTLEQAIDLRLDLRNSLFLLGELGQVIGYLRAAETLAEALDDHRRLGRVSGYMAAYFWAMGEPDRAIVSSQRALALATALGDFAMQVEANFHLGRAYYTHGEYHRAMNCLKWNVEALQDELLQERFGMVGLPSVLSRAFLALCLAELGMFAEGIAYGEEGARVAEVVNHPFSLITVYYSVGLLSLCQGTLDKAILALERAVRLCQDTNILLQFLRAASALGAAYALSGRVAQALPLLEQAVAQATTMSIMTEQSRRVAWHSEALLLAGRPEEANALAEQALVLARVHKERGHEAWALGLLGRLAVQYDPPQIEPAEAYYQQALALADEFGMRPLVAHCHLGLGTLYAKIGQREQARAELSTAMALYRAMTMTFWLSRAEAALVRMA